MGTQAKIQNIAFSSFSAEMDCWLDSPLGEVLLKAETDLLSTMLPRRFGYHLLQLGCSSRSMWADSPVGHKFSIAVKKSSIKGPQIVAHDGSLPIANESVDVVILHHALDFSNDQHQLLREVSRVLIEGGDVIIVGFNPYSCWGIRKALQWFETPPWQGQRLSTHRLSDWLKLLEFQVEEIKFGLYTWPFNSPTLIKYSSVFNKMATDLNWPTGGVYAIVAKKQVLPVTPIQPPWKKFRAKSALEPVHIPVPENSVQKYSGSNKSLKNEQVLKRK